MHDSLDEDNPWVDVSAPDVKSFIDARLRRKPDSAKTSSAVLLPKSRLSIKSVLLGVLHDKGQRATAEEIFFCSTLEELLGRFLKKDPWWVILCEVTDSMLGSNVWGLKAFVLKDRGYIYHEPGDHCTDESARRPILAAWEQFKDERAYKSAVLIAYRKHWKDAILPPYFGQWASGPFDVMLQAVSEILTRRPDHWPVVLKRLRDHDRQNTSFAKLAQKTSLKMGLRQDEMKEILLPYTSTGELSDRPTRQDLSEDRKRVLVGAYLCLIDNTG